MRQQIRQPLPALPRGDKAAPIGDRKIDRRQRAAAEDRAGDDDARRRLLIDHQPGADREDGGLQQQAQHLRHRAETAGDVAGALARRHVFAIEIAPAVRDAADHAHGGDRFGVAPARLHQRVARRRKLRGGAGRPPRRQFGEHRERDQDDRADERGQSDIGMKHETDDQIDRHPRQIEQCDRADAGQKAAHRVEVADRLRAFGPAAGFQRQPHDGIIDAHAHRLVEAVADAHQDTAADRFDDALRRIEAGDQDHQRDQRRHAAARQHAVVDFEHEQRAGEHQKVAHAAEHAMAMKARRHALSAAASSEPAGACRSGPRDGAIRGAYHR